MKLIEIENLNVVYEGKTALKDVSLAIDTGELVSVIGPNGAGKSSLMRAIIGAIPPRSGRIKRPTDLRLGYVPQKLEANRLMPISVDRFMRLPDYDATFVERVMGEHEITHLANLPMNELSGGETRRVLLAHAMMNEPELLILDEPTAGLDQPAIASFYSRIARLNREEGIAILIVSHDLNLVLRDSTRVICLNRHICCQGTPGDVATSPEYGALFGRAPLAFYEHKHNHDHDHPCEHDHV